jgi:hypothetical protein
MNSSFSMPLAAVLEMLSEFLDMLPQLHTVGIEFTVKRENGLPIGLDISLQCLLAEKTETSLTRIPLQDVEKP